MRSPRMANTCSNTCSNRCSERLSNTDGRTDGRTDGHKNSAHSHLNRYRFLTADRRKTTGNGDGGVV